jgi:peptide chain release factor 3
MGRSFLGCYDLWRDELILSSRANRNLRDEGVRCSGLDDPRLAEHLPDDALGRLREEVEMAKGLCPEFDLDAYRSGHLTPVYFGSALNSFGVRLLLDGLAAHAPPPRPQSSAERTIEPDESKVTAFVFKIQANMDPKHHDRIAFLRLCSGHFRRGMKLSHVRSGTTMTMHNPLMFLAQDRELAEEAFAGDILGIPNHGKLRIGDALTEGEKLHFTGIPSFAPELLQRVRPADPLKAKHLGRALEQLAEEGAARVFRPLVGSNWIVGVVGALQFDVLADRIRTEYNIPVHFESTSLYTARWVEAAEPALMKEFIDKNQGASAEDHTGAPVFLARNKWHLDTMAEDWPKVRFLKTKEHAPT